jgi:hypothetical protein
MLSPQAVCVGQEVGSRKEWEPEIEKLMTPATSLHILIWYEAGATERKITCAPILYLA